MDGNVMASFIFNCRSFNEKRCIRIFFKNLDLSGGLTYIRTVWTYGDGRECNYRIMNVKRCKILILRFSSLGDLILMSPLIRTLREELPESEIHIACKAKYIDIFTENKCINRVYMLHGGGFLELIRMLTRLRGERYDVVIDAHNVLRSRLLFHLIPAARKITIEKEHTKKLLLIGGKVNLYDSVVSQCDRYLECARKLGLAVYERPTELSISTPAEERVGELLVGAGIAGKPIVAIAPGARWATKRWPAEHFVGLIRALLDRGLGTILIGGDAETTLTARIAGRCPGTLDVAGSLSLLETGAVLKRCECLVTNDSAPLHIAEAVGTPVVAVFGPTVSEFGYYPRLPKSVAVEIDLDCRPCSRNGARPCPLGTKECLESIATSRVLAATERLLQIGSEGTVPSWVGNGSHS